MKEKPKFETETLSLILRFNKQEPISTYVKEVKVLEF